MMIILSDGNGYHRATGGLYCQEVLATEVEDDGRPHYASTVPARILIRRAGITVRVTCHGHALYKAMGSSTQVSKRCGHPCSACVSDREGADIEWFSCRISNYHLCSTCVGHWRCQDDITQLDDDIPPPVLVARKNHHVPKCEQGHWMMPISGCPPWYSIHKEIQCMRCYEKPLQCPSLFPFFWHCKACGDDVCMDCVEQLRQTCELEPPVENVTLPFRYPKGQRAAVDGFVSRGLFDRREGGTGAGRRVQVANYQNDAWSLDSEDAACKGMSSLVPEVAEKMQAEIPLLLRHPLKAFDDGHLAPHVLKQSELPSEELPFDTRVTQHPDVEKSDLAKGAIRRLQQDVLDFRGLVQSASARGAIRQLRSLHGGGSWTQGMRSQRR
ncbi:unnamed protein product [Prorocentrum cordatum]|uniref:RING-type domain-containing protein n=1 Tax=Prorocentrum cordatum TaxID=2364126 RepID=A0ABN9XC99_9DINO|nr:unnamed protein product [Polarella glacialis]